MSVQEYLDKQAIVYQSHVNVVNRTQATLKHQYQIQALGTIPKKHRPLPPTTVSTDSTKESFDKEFRRHYHELFFSSLQEAITRNTINLELERARCKDILMQTERELCSTIETGPSLAKRYNTFLQKLGIPDHEILPELRSKFETQPICKTQPRASKSTEQQRLSVPPPTPRNSNVNRHHTTSKKRKHNSSNPSGKKQMKLDSFLVRGPNLPKNPI